MFRLRTGLVANLVRRENLGTRLGLTIARNVTISGAVPTGQVPGEGGLPYISHIGRYVPPVRVCGVFVRKPPKTGIDLTYFGLESGMVFDGTTGVYERIYHFSSTLD